MIGGRDSWKSSGDMHAPGGPVGAGGAFPGQPSEQGALWRPKIVVRWVSPPPRLARRRHRPLSMHSSGFPLASVGNRNYEIFYSFLRSASGAIGGLA